MVIDFILAFKQLLVQQEEEAFNKFYLDTVDIFFRYLKANYFIDEDDMQDIIADFYIKCRNWFPSFDIDQNFSGWVWSIFKNTLKDFWKKKWESAFSEIDPENEVPFEDSLEDEEDYTEILDNEYTFVQIQKAMVELDEINKEIISLKFIEDKSYEEIAQILWISQDLVRQRCSRALKALKVKLWQ
jgi:RNA polymerase sigma-70 factor (ECF subfamily)